MSEELKQAISALQCAKRGHCDHAMADEAIAALEALTQRPAAQDEREADEVFLPRRLAATQKLTQLGYRYDSAHGKWLPAPQQATPEPDDAQRRFEAGCVVLEYLRDIGAPYRAVHHMLIALHGDPEAKSKATPEPVGEALQFPPMPEGWPARFRCDSCDGNGELGELVSMGDFQPPERQTCPDCGGRGWASEEPAFNADHMREFAEAHALLTRPAPGVPEGWRDAFDLAAQMLTWGRDEGLTPEQVNEVDAHAKLMFAMLAAQAKGADK